MTTGLAEFGAGNESIVAVAYLVAAGVFSLVFGTLGLVAGVVIIAAWYAWDTPYAIAVAHVSFLGLLPSGIEPVQFLFVELALLAVVLVHVLTLSTPGRCGAAVLIAVSALGGGTWLAIDSGSLWLAAVVFVVLLASGVYGIHRYERVVLELVDDDRENNPPQGSTEGSNT